MPSGYHHQSLTRQALISAGVTDAQQLAESYCNYPDYYFSERKEEVEPYIFFCDGIQFHYPPHTPVEEFYRYWNRSEHGNYPLRTQKNENIRHTVEGFSYYLTKTVALLKENNRQEAWKFLGCLLHFLEDSAFGVHALEGIDGTDLFVLDRLSGKNVAKYLCSLPFNEAFSGLTVVPEIFADNIEEAVFLLYSRCAVRTESSRQALFDLAVNHLYGSSRFSPYENEKTMFLNALTLAADTIATVVAIAAGNAPAFPQRSLNEFTPFHYPIGGGGGFALRKYEETENIFRFGINSEADLLFQLPENCYRSFSAQIKAEEASRLILQLISQGTCRQEFRLSGTMSQEVFLENPGGITGFKVFSEDSCGKISICHGIFSKNG